MLLDVVRVVEPHAPQLLALDRSVAERAGAATTSVGASTLARHSADPTAELDVGVQPVDQPSQLGQPFIGAGLLRGLLPKFGKLGVAHHVQHGVARLVEQQIVRLARVGQSLREVVGKVAAPSVQHHRHAFGRGEQFAREIGIDHELGISGHARRVSRFSRSNGLRTSAADWTEAAQSIAVSFSKLPLPHAPMSTRLGYKNQASQASPSGAPRPSLSGSGSPLGVNSRLHRIDAIALAGRRRAVGEDVALMRAAAGADDLGADHAVAGIADVLRGGRRRTAA